MTATHVDVLVVGAGLSGIGAGYRLQTQRPGRTYTILEARDTIGGTWDLFRYPGVRSDSDMFTLSYPFRPWTNPKSIADGPAIVDYIRTTAAKYGVMSIPTLNVYKGGEVVKTIVGAKPKAALVRDLSEFIA